MTDPVEDALRLSLAERSLDPSAPLDLPAVVAASRRRRRRGTTAAASAAAVLTLATGLTLTQLLHTTDPRLGTLAGPSAPAVAPTDPDELSRRVLRVLGPQARLVGPPEKLGPALLTRGADGVALAGQRRTAGAAVHAVASSPGRTVTFFVTVQAISKGGADLSARTVAAAAAGPGTPLAGATKPGLDYAVFARGQGVIAAALLADGSVATADVVADTGGARDSLVQDAVEVLRALQPTAR